MILSAILQDWIGVSDALRPGHVRSPPYSRVLCKIAPSATGNVTIYSVDDVGCIGYRVSNVDTLIKSLRVLNTVCQELMNFAKLQLYL